MASKKPYYPIDPFGLNSREDIPFENTTDRLGTMGSQSPNNPYKGIDPLSGMSGWNMFTDWLGFTNNRQQLLNEYEMNSNAWESQYALAMEDREYNDYSSQVERMRAAGLNPDRLDVSGGQSAAATAAGAAPRQTEATNRMVQSGQNFANGLVQVMQFVLGAASGISSIRNANLAGDMAALDKVLSGGVESAAGYVANQVMDSGADLDSFLSNKGKDFKNLVYDVPLPENLSRSGKRYAQRRLSEIFSSNEFRENVLNRIESTTTAATRAARSVGEFNAYNQDGITEVMTILARAGYEASLAERRASASYSRYNRTYYDTLSPTDASGLENSRNQYMTKQIQSNEKLRSAYDKMISNLFRLANDKKAGWLARNGASVALLGLYSLNGVSISGSSSSGPRGSSRSFSLGM